MIFFAIHLHIIKKQTQVYKMKVRKSIFIDFATDTDLLEEVEIYANRVSKETGLKVTRQAAIKKILRDNLQAPEKNTTLQS